MERVTPDVVTNVEPYSLAITFNISVISPEFTANLNCDNTDPYAVSAIAVSAIAVSAIEDTDEVLVVELPTAVVVIEVEDTVLPLVPIVVADEVVVAVVIAVLYPRFSNGNDIDNVIFTNNIGDIGVVAVFAVMDDSVFVFVVVVEESKLRERTVVAGGIVTFTLRLFKNIPYTE